jgi:crotonobetainyl-CoA:carnitine CoA-transferase CaiB-like acyl-CoA transferase
MIAHSSQRPLEGLRIIENANVITGPFAGQILADLGADVIKVENPQGDQFRLWDGAEASSDEVIPPTFAAYNRGKRSISIDLKTPQGVEVFRRLVVDADVVIENARPGAMDRLHVGYPDLKELNPQLVYCAISGMSSRGPEAKRPTFDAVAQAASGIWSQLTDMNDPEPVGPPLADQLTALFAVIGILSALRARDLTGEGGLVETNMLAACLGFQPHSIAASAQSDSAPDRLSRARVSQSYAFVDVDGRPFAIHLSTPQKFWEGLCDVVGRTDLVQHPDFANKRGRIAKYLELRAILQETFATRTRDHWLALLRERDVPAAPILRLDEALASEQVRAIGIIHGADTADGTGLATESNGMRVKLPIEFAGEFAAAIGPPPRLGEHTRDLLGECGYDTAACDELFRTGSVR